MNIDNWNIYYKQHETENRPSTTQMCYEPRINPEGTVFCMNFNFPSEYQSSQPRYSYTRKLVEFAFEREIRYLEIFKDESWAPEIIDITDNKIFIKWYGNTCNDLLYKKNNLPSTWKQDIEKIIYDQFLKGYYKPSVYPHSHFYDDTGTMRAIDFYTCVETTNTFLNYSDIEGLVGTDTSRFADATTDGLVDISLIFKSGLLAYGKWPDNLTGVYKRIFS